MASTSRPRAGIAAPFSSSGFELGRRHLELNGRLVFDLFNPSVHQLAKPVDPAETDDEPPFSHPDGRTVTRRSRILERAGFSVEHVYSGFDGAPYGSRYPGELIFVARRRPAS